MMSLKSETNLNFWLLSGQEIGAPEKSSDHFGGQIFKFNVRS